MESVFSFRRGIWGLTQLIRVAWQVLLSAEPSHWPECYFPCGQIQDHTWPDATSRGGVTLGPLISSLAAASHFPWVLSQDWGITEEWRRLHCALRVGGCLCVAAHHPA